MRRFLAALFGVVALSVANGDTPLVVAVMDPLAAPLSCPCVEGYAQRDYTQLAKWLSQRLGREVALGFGSSLVSATEDAQADAADLVIGKDSVVRAEGAALSVAPLALLTDRLGETTQAGLLVVPADDAAQSVADLQRYDVYFGPASCDEKHLAAAELLRSAGVTIRKTHISAACSEGATAILERTADSEAAPAAAVISSYAEPLLEGCGTIQAGDLRVVGKTEPTPFVVAFATDHLQGPQREALLEALLDAVAEPRLLQALETLRGFVPPDDDYRKMRSRLQRARDELSKPAGGVRPSPSDNGSWPGFRGPNRDNVVRWLPASLPESPSFIWRQPLRRSGLGGVAVSEGVVLIGDRDLSNEWDVWRCFDAATGEPRWTSRYPAPGRLDYDNAPRATPLLADGRAYLLGAFGDLSCVDLAEGSLVWRMPLRLLYGDSRKLTWGACCSPLLARGVLVVCPAADDAVWLGLDPETGGERWTARGDAHAFASPVLAPAAGEPQFVGYDRTTLGGWSVETGKRLWSHRPAQGGDFNVPTPVLVGDRLFVVTENNGARLFGWDGGNLQVPATGSIADLAPDTSSPTARGGRVFCLYEGLQCLEASETGGLRVAWRGEDGALPETGFVIAGSTATGAGRLLVVGRGGCLLLLDADATDCRIVSRLNLFGVEPEESEDLLCQPALVGSRLYLRSESELVCVDLATAG